MAIRIKCSKCEAKFSVKDAAAGLSHWVSQLDLMFGNSFGHGVTLCSGAIQWQRRNANAVAS